MPIPESVLPKEKVKEKEPITLEYLQQVVNQFLSDSYNCKSLFRSVECDVCENENCKRSYDLMEDIWKESEDKKKK